MNTHAISLKINVCERARARACVYLCVRVCVDLYSVHPSRSAIYIEVCVCVLVIISIIIIQRSTVAYTFHAVDS